MGRASPNHGMRMHRQRQIAEEILHLSGLDVILGNLGIDIVLVLSAIGALEIGVFHDCYRRVRFSSEGFMLRRQRRRRRRWLRPRSQRRIRRQKLFDIIQAGQDLPLLFGNCFHLLISCLRAGVGHR
jgi:hypothetical protein